MFALTDHAVKISAVTNGSENHGQELVPALSIGLSITGASTLLDEFDPGLRDLLFRRPAARPGDLPMADDNLSELRFPLLRNIQWNRDFAGYQIRFHIGASGAEDVLVSDVGIKEIHINPLEGGSVQISLKARCHPQDDFEHGKLSRLLKHEITIDLTPPDVDPSLFDDDEQDEAA
jgi:hypothetical protein